MNLRRRTRDDAEVSTESLNDIMFFLLLFFLIISTLANPNVVKLDLPRSTAQKRTVQKEPITLSASKDKRFFLQNKEVPFAELENALLAVTNNVDSPKVSLNIDPQLNVQDLTDLLQLGVKTNVKMILGSLKPTQQTL
jgi:biopolymer transport protein ExbD